MLDLLPGRVQVLLLTTESGRSRLHLAWVRAGLESAVFLAERLGADVVVDAVNAAAVYQHRETEERRFSLVTRLKDMRR